MYQNTEKSVISTGSSSRCFVTGNNGAAKPETKVAAEMDDDKDSCPSLVSDDKDLPPLVHLTTSHRAAQPAQQAQQAQQASAPRGMGMALPGRHSQGMLRIQALMWSCHRDAQYGFTRDRNSHITRNCRAAQSPLPYSS